MLLSPVTSPTLHKKESRYEREQRIKVGSITGYDPRKESATRRLVLEDSAYIDGNHSPCGTWERERASESRHAYSGTLDGGRVSDGFKNAAGCNITRYSGQHSYSPLSASLSELNLAKCKREDESTRHLSGSLPGPAGMEKFMQKAKLELVSRNQEMEDARRTLTNPAQDEEDSHRRELQMIKDAENRKHSYKLLPNSRSPIELDRYEDFPGDQRPLSHGPPIFEKFQTTALYDFKAENPRELELTKGDALVVSRRVDANWYEGESKGRSGIFPISYVSPRSSSSNHPRSPAVSPASRRKTVLSKATAKYAYKAQSPIELSFNKGDSISITRVVDKNWSEGLVGSKSGIFPSSYVSVIGSNGVGPSASLSAAGNLSIHARLQQLPEPPALKTFERENPFIKNNHRNGFSSNNNENDVSLYKALFNYKPQHEDEVELVEGDFIVVLEKCDDGWFVGTSRRTGAFGTFPGNYVVLA